MCGATYLHDDFVTDGELMKKSGGGDLYRCPEPYTGMIYKHIKEPSAMANLVAMCDSLAGLKGSDWVVPKAMVYDSRGQPSGYLMPMGAGKPLSEWEASFSSEFPLVEVIGRVAVAIEDALNAGIAPIIEHGANVLVCCSVVGVTVSIVDIDGCHKLDSRGQGLSWAFEQLGSIFMNFDRHTDFPSFFEESAGGVTKLTSGYADFRDIVTQCRFMSGDFHRWYQRILAVGNASIGAVAPAAAPALAADDVATIPSTPPLAPAVGDDLAIGDVTPLGGMDLMDDSADDDMFGGHASEEEKCTNGMPAAPAISWSQQPTLHAMDCTSVTGALDEFARLNPDLSKVQLLLKYVRDLPSARPLSQLVRAEIAYLFFKGDECPLLFEGDSDTWFVHHHRWKVAKKSFTRVKALFQTKLLEAIREVAALAKRLSTFPRSGDGPHPRAEFLDKTVGCLECRESVEKLIKESSIFFDRAADFDVNPWLFQLQNCTLDLRTNTFKRSCPSDMCLRCSPITIPEAWLEDPSLIELAAADLRDDAWKTMWSLFRRNGDPHPDDDFGVLGDQDRANFEFFMHIKARMLEGTPLAKCLMLYSLRGRNGKGITEKCYQAVWGDYYTPIKSSVFHTDKRNENEHSAADIARKGARVGFGNETLSEPWSNAIFKVQTCEGSFAKGQVLSMSRMVA